MKVFVKGKLNKGLAANPSGSTWRVRTTIFLEQVAWHVWMGNYVTVYWGARYFTKGKASREGLVSTVPFPLSTF
jgi:hypothetical protein